MSNIEPVTQEAHTIAVHREIESARLMEAQEVEDADRVKAIDSALEFNALMEAGVMLNQGNYFDLYV
jgi:hypothetical protein